MILIDVALALGFLGGYLWQQPELERLRREATRPAGPGAQAGSDSERTARGVIRDVRRDERTVLITHEALDDRMGAMTMPFRAADPGLLDAATIGERVQFTFRARGGGLVLVALRRDAS
jgi:Cu/Ag efflux protein CusF